MSAVVDMPGAAHLVLADGVVHLDPEPAVLEAMLEGWALQQRTRFLRESTIYPRIALVRRLARFTNEYPWQWEPAEMEAFFDNLRTRRPGRPLAVSTARNHQNDLRLFFDYITDTRYGWPSTCKERFGRIPVQLLHEWNTITHCSEYEGAAERRPLTYDEVQALFDAAEGRVEEIRARRRKGSLAALRDAMVLKTVYAFGLRRQEACGLDLHSLRHSYVTHLIEFGYPEKFVQDQVGHAYASTTAIYSHVSDEFRNRLLRRSLQARHGDLWGQEA